MAHIISHFWPGATEEQYWKESEVVHPGGKLPQGNLYFAAGQADGGVLVVSIWDSEESYLNFANQVLLPEIDAPGGFEGRPDGWAAESFDLKASPAEDS
jgi:hypothetical protein